MPTAPDNHQRLREAGVIRTDRVPDEYREVIDNLDETQVTALLDVWERLNEVDRVDLQPGELPRWVMFMFF